MSWISYLKKYFVRKNKGNNSIYFKNSTTKHSMTASCTLKLSTETEKNKKEINENLKQLIKKYIIF